MVRVRSRVQPPISAYLVYYIYMTIYSRNTILEALRSEYKIHDIYLERNINVDKKIDRIIELAEKKKVPVHYIDKFELFNRSNTKDHQGVIANVNYQFNKIEDVINSDKSLIYISEATYEHNVGAIIRSAECAGLGGVILPKGIEISPLIARVSTGAIFHIPVLSYSIYQAIKIFKDNNFELVAIERGGENIYKCDISNKLLLIIGSEDKGISGNLINHCDKIVSIPQYGEINSLNMSVAAGIGMFEHIRQKLNK